jgi:hypothetical protein
MNDQMMQGMMQGGGDENPFASILQQLQGGGGGMPPMDAGPMMATQPAAPQGPKIGPDGKPLPDVTQRGQNPGTSKFVVQAMQAMQGALAEATDPQEIQMLRQILSMLVKVVDEDQKRQGVPSSGMNPAQMMG